MEATMEHNESKPANTLAVACATWKSAAQLWEENATAWRADYIAAKAERDELLAACRACVAGERGWGEKMDAAIAKAGGVA